MQRKEFLQYGLVLFGFQMLKSKTAYSQDNYLQQIEEELLGICKPYLSQTKDFALRPEAATAFENMKTAAKLEGIDLAIASGYRGYEQQKKIWNKKFTNFIEKEKLSQIDALNKCIEFSAIPGTSRHHWGTEIDIIDLAVEPCKDPLIQTEFLSGGRFEKLYNWLKINANNYGFYEIYTDVATRTGFKFEPWHYSYKPLSANYLEIYLSIPLKKYLTKGDILGSQFFTDEFIFNYVNKYALGISY